MTTFQAMCWARTLRGRAGGRQRGARARAEAPAQPPRRPRERVVRDGREAGLVGAQGKQEVGDAVGRGQLGIGGRDAEAVHALAAWSQQERAGLAHEPGSELPLFNRKPRLSLQLAFVVPEEVAEQALRGALRPIRRQLTRRATAER